ncbi:adenosylmethionine decarboxylase [Paracoccus saliphilus]|uniref:Adenosylmethionine decarboxylase n=1 Tax=Paracoccus saliphilus TaxID=405559 RepID=A0AA46A3U3_9RHOB|nr:adenosylmethionine decarboxylase [Paracoccus saliphilus]WCR03265.1 adenosylmethionine decarboxylase [Paracoccus saliphilus]SIS50467.1 S-adenosylmethionine decarboxylase [Paracoccus saliphilus]
MIDSEKFAPGAHLLIDHFGGRFLDEPARLEAALRAAAKAAGATILSGAFHHFGGGNGVTGVLLLAESHISIHTWPERDYAAIDIFMCGDADAERAAEMLASILSPQRIEMGRFQRGHSNHCSQPSM